MGSLMCGSLNGLLCVSAGGDSASRVTFSCGDVAPPSSLSCAEFSSVYVSPIAAHALATDPMLDTEEF